MIYPGAERIRNPRRRYEAIGAERKAGRLLRGEPGWVLGLLLGLDQDRKDIVPVGHKKLLPLWRKVANADQVIEGLEREIDRSKLRTDILAALKLGIEV